MMFKFLVSGFDTIECAYYLMPSDGFALDFVELAAQKEALNAKSKKTKEITLGTESFQLASHGTGSGFTFLIENDVFSIQFGEFNRPNFYVTFRSIALWHYGAAALHQRFLDWALSIGMTPYQPERLSRVDFAFDYDLKQLDFDEDQFITQFVDDNKHRKHRKTQTIRLGGDVLLLRIYNKVDEINQKSHKTWFFEIWGQDKDVWRFEWQVRKDYLRQFKIITFQDLLAIQGDVMRYLTKEHTVLKIPTNDSNRSRWPIHPLWQDLIEQAKTMEGLGIVRSLDKKALLEERLTRIAISVYGYIKRVAAIDALYTGKEKTYMDEAFDHLFNRISELHDPLTWQQEVNRRVKEMQLGEW